MKRSYSGRVSTVQPLFATKARTAAPTPKAGWWVSCNAMTRHSCA
jgi:hypothetical protein